MNNHELMLPSHCVSQFLAQNLTDSHVYTYNRIYDELYLACLPMIFVLRLFKKN